MTSKGGVDCSFDSGSQRKSDYRGPLVSQAVSVS